MGIDVGNHIKFKQNPERLQFLNEEMKRFMAEHSDTMAVEKIDDTAAKLCKYGFWVTFDLLEQA